MILLNQTILVSLNSKPPTQFKVVRTEGNTASLSSYEIGEDAIYTIGLTLIPPPPPEMGDIITQLADQLKATMTPNELTILINKIQN